MRCRVDETVDTGREGSLFPLCFGAENEYLEVGVTGVEFGQQIGRRQARQLAVEEHNIEAEVITLRVETPTVEDAARAVGTSQDQIVKSLLFLIDDEPVLAIACGTTRIDRRSIAAHFGVGRKRVKMADADSVLSLTGYPVGGVPPFGMREQPTTLVDERLFEHEQVYTGGGDVNTLLRVSPQEVMRVAHGVLMNLLASSGG